jgi:hypothetical protein
MSGDEEGLISVSDKGFSLPYQIGNQRLNQLKNWTIEATGQDNYKIQVITDEGLRMTINLNKGQNGSAMEKG